MPATIYKASAGSGKTYTLAQTWLCQALAEPQAYRQILSITFTRKATAEIKDRLLRFLFELSHQPQQQAPLRRYLCRRLDVSDDTLTRRAHCLLSHLLQDYGRIGVYTIDSFFQQVIAAFVAELGLPWEHTLEMNTERVTRYMADDLLRRLGRDETLTQWVLSYALEQMQNQKTWQPDALLQGLSAQLLSDKHLPHLLRLHLSAQDLDELRTLTRDILRTHRSQVEALVAQAEGYLQQYDLRYEDFYSRNILNPLKNLVFDLKAGKPFLLMEAGVTFVRALAGNQNWYSKTATKGLAIDKAMDNGLLAVLQQLYDLAGNPEDPRRQTAAAAWLVRESLFRLGLYEHLREGLDAYKQAEGMVLIGEAGQLIARLHREGSVPFLYEKLGERYNRIFLDEFQDTSSLQWENLLPLVENALAVEGEALLVGDVKQSIYRFRGGNSNLLREVARQDIRQMQGQAPEEQTLAHNYRSLAQVVHFNNSICAAIPRLPYHDDLEASAIARLLGQVYEDAAQLPSHTTGGYVRAEVFEPTEEEPLPVQQVVARLPGLVQEILDLGYAPSDIALLVNTNAEASQVTQLLMAAGYQVYAAQGLVVHAGARVRILVEALRWLANPEDHIALYAAAAGLCALQGRPMPTQVHPQEVLSYRLPLQLPELLQLPVYAQATTLARLLDLVPAGQTHDAYLTAFFAQLHAQAQQGSSLADFLRFYEEEGHQKPVTLLPGNQALQVMTIHKSKGLEFPVVILPFANWSLKPAAYGDIVWADRQAPFLQAEAYPLRLSRLLRDSLFANAHQQEYQDFLLDKINSLYVGLTRAIEQLYMLIPHKPREKYAGISQVDELLLLALRSTETRASPHSLQLADHWTEAQVWESGMRQRQVARSAAETSAVPAAETPLCYQEHPAWQQVLQLRNRTPLGGREEMAIARGELFHLLLSRIATPADLPQVLAHAVQEGLISVPQQSLLKDQLAGILHLPQLAPYLQPDWAHYPELDILGSRGELLRPDRVVVKHPHAVVIDYKTGQPQPAHIRQVRQYLQALADMGLRPTEGLLVYLDKVKIEQVPF
ncbi:MAG: UvrD-helicase domain-containing protein [Bacteroidetes bacterium]|nr:UvrD-helicase domain-containing protein [Bacteroidota bacterium]